MCVCIALWPECVDEVCLMCVPIQLVVVFMIGCDELLKVDIERVADGQIDIASVWS